MPPRRCFPRGSSEAAFHGIFQRRRCAQRRRSLFSFSPPPPGRTSFFASRTPLFLHPFVPPDGRDSAAFFAACPGGGAARSLFALSAARPALHLFFCTPPPATGCRARSPRRCSPKGSSEAAFHGLLQGRRGDASRWARLRRLSAGFCRVAEAMLPVGLVRGGFLRGFETAALRAAPPFPFVLLSPPPGRTSFFTQPSCQRCRTPLFLHPFVPPDGRDSAAFFAACPGGGAARSLFALSAARPALHLFFYTPPPGERMPRARSRPCEPASSPFPFPHFPTARSYFFLYPAVLPAMPHATFPASICPAGRQGQRRFLCRLHGRRSSALPFRPIGGAPGTAPRFLHPAARGTDAAHGRPIHPDRQDNPSSLSHASGRRARPCEPAGSPFYFHSFPRASRASGRRPRTAHPPCSCARLLLFAAAPAASLLRFPPRFAFRAAHSCARVPSAPVSSVPRCLVPRRRALYPALFLRGRTHRAVLSPFPTHARPVRPPRTPCAPGLCASRRGGGSYKASCCALLHARPCSCAGGRIAPFFRLSPRAPRAFPSQRSLRAGLCIASRWRKL